MAYRRSRRFGARSRRVRRSTRSMRFKRPPLMVPKRMTVMLPYTQYYDVSHSANNTWFSRVSANSVYDPEATTTIDNLTAIGLGNYRGLYQRCIVRAAYLTATFTSAFLPAAEPQQPVVWGVTLQNDTTNPSNNVSYQQLQKNTLFRVFPPGSTTPQTIKMKYKWNQFDTNAQEGSLYASLNASPTQRHYFLLWAQHEHKDNEMVLGFYHIRWSIRYKVTFDDPWSNYVGSALP